jgi:hypothetical protein
MGKLSREYGTTDEEQAESETHLDQVLGVGISSPDGQAPSFTCSRQSIREAYERKNSKYQDLAQVIGGRPCDPGRRVQVLPWAVWVRGVLDATGIQKATTFLEGPASKLKLLKEIFRKSAAASGEALVCLHKVRRSGASRGSIREVDTGRKELAGKRRTKRRQSGESAERFLDRWKWLRTDLPRVDLQQRNW